MFLADSSDVIEFSLVLFEVSKSNNGSSFLVDQLSESGFVLHNSVGDVKRLAEGGEEDDCFNRVDVGGDEDQLGSFLFYEVGDVVQSVFKSDGLGFLAVFLIGGLLSGGGPKSVSLLLSGFGGVFSQNFDQLRSCG